MEDAPYAGKPCYNCGTPEGPDFLTFDTPYHPTDPHAMRLCLNCLDAMSSMVASYFYDLPPTSINDEEMRIGRKLGHWRYLQEIGYQPYLDRPISTAEIEAKPEKP